MHAWDDDMGEGISYFVWIGSVLVCLINLRDFMLFHEQCMPPSVRYTHPYYHSND